MIVIWIAAIVVFGIVEAVTVGLVSIWFVLGAVAGLLAADVNHDNVVDAKDAYSIQIYVHYNAFTVPAGN